MSYNLNPEFDFSDESLETPDMILEDIGIQLNSITKTLVQGNCR